MVSQLFRRGWVLLLCAIFMLPLGDRVEGASGTAPVVQLIAYSDIYGNYVSQLGWGSASVITQDGIILSNNHVVDSGNGQLASAFSVCISRGTTTRPSCDYTASLIDRNEAMDISILQIDPLDVHGNKVDYSTFTVLPIDYSYVPTVQDDTVIIGFPWVGANTITETKGIISGTTEYNGYQYIKTDAVIAGGNSGGAMISSSGKLIGIPTFTMGGFFDASLGYGLSIAEAKEFIQEALAKKPQTRAHKVNFPQYQKSLDTINASLSVKDDFLELTFPKDYEVNNYIKNRYVTLTNKVQKDTAVNMLSFDTVLTPTLENEKAFLSYMGRLGYYYEDYQKLVKKTIGGITFFTPVWKGDPSNGESNGYTTYFAQINPTLIVTISISAPMYDEKLNEKVKEEVNLLLAGVKFSSNIKNTAKSFTFDLKEPMLNITPSVHSIYDDYTGYFMEFFENLHTYVYLSLETKNIYSGKGQTFDELYLIETKDVPADYKAKITFQGMKGYVACQNSTYGYLPYTGQWQVVSDGMYDEKGVPVPPLQRCLIRVLEGLKGAQGNEYFLNITVTAPEKNLEATLEKTFTFLREQVKTESTGATVFVNPFKQKTALKFTDIADQTEDYRKMLQIFVKYGLLENTGKFDPNKPLHWREFLPVYLKAAYNIDLKKTEGCGKNNLMCQLRKAKLTTPDGEKEILPILKEMKISFDSYVGQDDLDKFILIFHAKLAGVEIGTFSERDLARWATNPSYYKDGQEEKMNAFDSFLYGKYRIGLSEAGFSGYAYYDSSLSVMFESHRGIVTYPNYSDVPYDFSPEGRLERTKLWNEQYKDVSYEALNAQYEKVFEEFKKCVNSGKNPVGCLTTFTLAEGKLAYEEETPVVTSYSVLTKAALYDFLSAGNMDLAFFDPELAKLKELEIDPEESASEEASSEDAQG